MGSRQRWIRKTFSILGWLFFICVIIQVFLAGAAIFVEYRFWNDHKSFIHFFEFIPIIMLVLSFFGKIPTVFRWQCFSLFLLIISQYATIQLQDQIPYLSALHPVSAMVLFWLSLKISSQSIKYWEKSEGVSK